MRQHTHFLCTCARSAQTRTMFTVMQNHKSSQMLPQGQFSRRHRGGSRVFTEVQAFVLVNKGILLPPLLLSRLNPIMCHHSSPTRLFPSYRQRWLPISLNCLLCKVTAEERRWERPVLAFSCSSLTGSSPKERIHLRTTLNTFGKLPSCVDLEWNFRNQCGGLLYEKEKSLKNVTGGLLILREERLNLEKNGPWGHLRLNSYSGISTWMWNALKRKC